MRQNRTKLVGAAAAIAAAIALPAGALADSHEMAKVRVAHFSPDAPAVDVYANGGAVLENVPFGVISDYLEVPGGEYQIQVVPTGATIDEGPVVIDATLTFDAGTMTTVAATNALESIEAQVVSDEPMPQDGIAQVRVAHFSADAPAVDIAVDEGDVVVPNLAYPATAGYLDLPEGEYDLEIRPTGTTDVAFDIDPLQLDGGSSFTVFAIGSLADDSFTVLPVLDASLMDGMSEDGEAMSEDAEEMSEDAEASPEGE